LDLLRTAIYFSLTLTLYRVGALLTVWNSTSVKLTNVPIYDYKLCQSSIIRTDSIKDLSVFIDSKLHFHYHVNYIISHCVKLLGLVRCITFNFSSLECMLRLYTTLVRSKLECVSVVSIQLRQLMPTSWNTSSRGLQPFVLIVFPQVHYCCSLALEKLKLYTLRIRRHRLDDALLIKFTLVSNSARPFWKLLVSEFLLGTTETLRCSVSAPHVKIVPLLVVHQLLVLSAGTLTYSEPGTFSSVVFNNMLYLLLILYNVRVPDY
jgi:hypothetical protein